MGCCFVFGEFYLRVILWGVVLVGCCFGWGVVLCGVSFYVGCCFVWDIILRGVFE